MAVQEAKYSVAMDDLDTAQGQLNKKEAELQEVQSMYERAVKEKQVFSNFACNFHIAYVIYMHVVYLSISYRG